MEVESKEIAPCRYEFHCSANNDDIAEKISNAVAKLRNQKIPGFRPGKAPDHAIKSKCKEQINNFVKIELVQQAFDDAVFETRCKPIGMPEFSQIDFDGKKFECTFVVGHRPKIELSKYSGFELTKPELDRDVDAQVQKSLNDISKNYGEIEPYTEDDFIEIGDQVTLDVLVDGHEDLSEEGMFYTVGDGKYSSDFDQNILGMSLEEVRDFTLNLDDKELNFTVTFHMGTKQRPVELTDELAKGAGAKDLEDLKRQLGIIVQRKIDSAERQQASNDIVNLLLENNKVDLPDWLINSEMETFAKANGKELDSFSDDEKKAIRERVVRSVSLTFVLDEIREVEPEAALTGQEAQQLLLNRVAQQGQDPAKFFEQAQETNQLQSFLGSIMNEHAIGWVFENSSWKEENNE